MDISVLLALDTAAFQQGLKAAADALGQFKAGADACFEALGKAQAQIDAAADAAAKEAAKVTEAAEAARAQAKAEREAAAAAKEAGDASAAAAGGAEDLSGALQKAKGGLGVVGGATAMASGSLQGMAGGAIQAANGMRMLGMSTQAAMKATAVLAVAAAVAMVAKAIRDAEHAARDLESNIRLDNLRLGAEGAAKAWENLCASMERASRLAKAGEDAAGGAARLARDRRLAEIERDRNRELAAGGDADEVNARYDALRRDAEFAGLRDENAASVAALERERDEARRRAEEARAQQRETTEQRDEAQSRRDEALARMEEEAGGFSFAHAAKVLGMNRDFDRAKNEFEGYSGEIPKLDERIDALDRAALEAEDLAAALDARIATEKGRAAVIGLQEEAARLAAAAAARPKPEPEAAPGAERGGGWGALQTASDRLARIGGFVGGGYARQNEAREQVQIARQNQRYLAQIAENTRNREPGGLA